ncbi:hypothetical protein C0J08_11510 [Marinomonas sp. CT5]|uniref:prepilin peptidase n=1 Tax=Marinomonas sp. CT5 TaxID=2066133 RepID=UPI001BAEE87A|nr:A24 family peptidase [Marinomonas sp. CT5]QUX95996.1 hypothetical protein C0J08_11510 [Marinomonas sp. CT5]
MTFLISEYLIYILITLSIGSFIASYTARWPIKAFYLWEKEAHQLLSKPFYKTKPLPITTSRSQCFHCFHTLTIMDLIPLISFIALKGNCRYCHHKISYRYPIIELLHLIFCLLLFTKAGDIYQLSLLTILASALMVSAVIDFEQQLIPDGCNIVVLGCALILNIMAGSIENSVLGMLFGYTIIYGVRFIYYLLKHQEGIGLGDAKLLAALGAWLGISNLAYLLLGASLSGILYTICLRKNGPKHLSFGPFLIFSALLVFYFHP